MAKVRSFINPVSRGVNRFTNEKNDCTVRALANATELPYDECHELMASFGRINGQPLGGFQLTNAYASIGVRLVCTFGSTNNASFYTKAFSVKNLPGRTVKTLLNQLKEGKYIVSVKGHVFAVVDGDIVDYGMQSGSMSATVLWEVTC